MNFFSQHVFDRAACFIPWPHGEHSCFFSLRPTLGGPGTFSQKLSREFIHQGIEVTYSHLRRAQSALIFSGSWGNWFYRLCDLWKIRVVIRVDGFHVPVYFDNRPQPSHYQDRRLGATQMAFNYRLQRDLLSADFVIYQSMYSKYMADQYLYNRRENYAVIHNGVDLTHFSPGPSRLGRRRLLIAGMLRDEYMLGTVLPVFERLWKSHDLELLIIGKMEFICQQQINEFCERFPLAAERVKVIGSVANDKLPSYMWQADVLIHPRLGDACPNIVVEALACGLPVVCGSWGGSAELVGDAGVIVQTDGWAYGDEFISGLTEGVERILNDLSEYQQQARSRAKANFEAKRIAKQYLEALKLI